MGAAARKIAQTVAPSQPRLRVVGGTSASTRTRARSAASASTTFRVVAVCLVVLATTGIARVTLAANAAEAAIDSWDLKAQVKAERLESRTLEADRSALAAPSRIEAVAAATLDMTRPTQVSYLQLPDTAVPASGGRESAAKSQVAEKPSGPGVIRTIMDLAASEAQVLLVGDVGLGTLQ